MAARFVTMKHKDSGAVITGVNLRSVPAHEAIGYRVLATQVADTPDAGLMPARAVVAGAPVMAKPVEPAPPVPTALVQAEVPAAPAAEPAPMKVKAKAKPKSKPKSKPKQSG